MVVFRDVHSLIDSSAGQFDSLAYIDSPCCAFAQFIGRRDQLEVTAIVLPFDLGNVYNESTPTIFTTILPYLMLFRVLR